MRCRTDAHFRFGKFGNPRQSRQAGRGAVPSPRRGGEGTAPPSAYAPLRQRLVPHREFGGAVLISPNRTPGSRQKWK